jgi:hypothetical protein
MLSLFQLLFLKYQHDWVVIPCITGETVGRDGLGCCGTEL